MLIKKSTLGRSIRPSEITSEEMYFNRRSFLSLLGGSAVIGSLNAHALPRTWLSESNFREQNTLAKK